MLHQKQSIENVNVRKVAESKAIIWEENGNIYSLPGERAAGVNFFAWGTETKVND
jgi:hypothetical protein